jgi:hypothetical protein
MDRFPPRPSQDSGFGISRPPAYGHGVRIILLCFVATVVFPMLGGCASGKKKSSVRLYEGNTSPNIKMFEEKPGYPLNDL